MSYKITVWLIYLEMKALVKDWVDGALDNFRLLRFVVSGQKVDLHHSVRSSGQQVRLVEVLGGRR